MTKRWIRAALLDPWNDILLRTEAIQALSTMIDAIPETRFTMEEQSLIQEQRRVPTVQTLSDIISKNDQLLSRDVLLTFATNLDQIHSYKMVHWDVKPANICFDGEQLFLVDWEPSLVQVRGGRTTMVVSPEFMAPSERHSVGPTAVSDRFGWIKTLTMLGIPRVPKDWDEIERALRRQTCLEATEELMEGYDQIR